MDGGSRRSGDFLAGLTLGAVLGNEKETPPPQVNRTLLDIIQAEEPNSKAYKNIIDHHHSKKSWKSLKDRLRPKRAGTAWVAAVASTSLDMDSAVASENNQHPPLAQLLRIHSVCMVDPLHEDHQFGELLRAETSQVQLLNRSLSLRTDLTQEDSFHVEQVPVSDAPVINNLSSMLRLNSSLSGQSDEPVRSLRLYEALAAEREQIQRVVSSNEAVGSAQEEGEVSESANDNRERGAVDEDQQVRMSLMDLLEETDRQMGWSSYTGDVDDDEESKNAEKEGSNLVERNCCVCMVRDKGSAFIPCGHTFCRLCSRELWVNRGNCPLCNGFILEILDIF